MASIIELKQVCKRYTAGEVVIDAPHGTTCALKSPPRVRGGNVTAERSAAGGLCVARFCRARRANDAEIAGRNWQRRGGRLRRVVR